MKPYYQDDWVTIYHGDCREILPTLSKVDLVITDPPYGIGASSEVFFRKNKQTGKSLAVSGARYFHSDWDNAPPSNSDFFIMRNSGKFTCFWGGNYFYLPPSASWLVWDKDNGGNRYADAELAWTNYGGAVRRLRYRWMGMIQEHMGNKKEERWHPTQKPLEVMTWAISLSPENQTIIDPYLGSGTTLRAAKDLKRHAIGIEIEEKYCEIAAKRMAQEVLI